MPRGVARTDAEIRADLDAIVGARGNLSEAGRTLGVSPAVMHQRASKLRAKGLLTKAMEEEWRSRESYHSGRRLPQTADECWAVLDDFIGRSRKTPVQQKRTARKTERGEKLTSRIVIASDFHAPFTDYWCVGELIARESSQTDQLIIAGDLQDFFSISRFLKYENVSIESELAAVDALLGQLSAAFPKILIVAGNHDHARFEKQLRSQLSLEMCHVIEVLTGGNLSVIKVLAQRYPNITFGGHQVERHRISWFTQVGDILVSHAEKFSVVPGAALRAVESWFTDQDGVLGLKPWRVIAQAHTHQMGWFPFKSDKVLCEIGCLSATHGYQLQSKVGGRPQRRGYMKCTQVNGVTDLNSIRLVWLDAERERVA
jgi:predicted phosphodiesterase